MKILYTWLRIVLPMAVPSTLRKILIRLSSCWADWRSRSFVELVLFLGMIFVLWVSSFMSILLSRSRQYKSSSVYRNSRYLRLFLHSQRLCLRQVISRGEQGQATADRKQSYLQTLHSSKFGAFSGNQSLKSIAFSRPFFSYNISFLSWNSRMYISINSICRCSISSGVGFWRRELIISWSVENTEDLPYKRYLSVQFRPNPKKSGSAKLQLSATLNPVLKPAWYPQGNVSIISPACWVAV